MYGPKKEEAVRLFERALELAPESRIAHFEYALRLEYLDKDGGAERALELLSRAAGIPVVDAYDGFIQELVVAELAARKGG